MAERQSIIDQDISFTDKVTKLRALETSARSAINRAQRLHNADKKAVRLQRKVDTLYREINEYRHRFSLDEWLRLQEIFNSKIQ